MKDKYQSLIEHVGNAKDWDLSRKNSGVTILPPYSYSKKASPLVTGEYRGKIDALAGVHHVGQHEVHDAVAAATLDCGDRAVLGQLAQIVIVIKCNNNA